jgi:hypothetical protein
MADLITTARAKYNLNNLTTTSSEDTTLAALVTACSKAIKKFCRREFDSQTFDELYHGQGQEKLLLRQFPLLGVSRVAYDPVSVLRVQNSSASNQRATVAVTSSGLTLVRVASGTVTTDTSITWAGNATLGAVATAITALGNGWSAAVVDARYSSHASADLRALQGALNAKDVEANLVLHASELSSYDFDFGLGALLRPDETWTGGPNYWRIIYSAGYATVPEDVQEACAQWVASLFWKTKRDPGLASESVPSSVARVPMNNLPPEVRSLLEPYHDRRIMQL